jgi:4-amino-4-deoxy-L-arabinose transferase-like glycosyltransferase
MRRLAGALRRLPIAAWVCALVAVLNAAGWSIVSPPFQTTDEPAHFAYVQYLAETGHLPSSGKNEYAPAEEVALRDLRWPQVRGQPGNRTIQTDAQQRRLQRDLDAPNSRTGVGDAGLAVNEPPLYYALESVPYGLASGGTILDQLALMRLLSALMAGFTALFAFCFIRETLPGAPWAWTVGGLGVALAPVLGEMSGAVNPDALLYSVSAALFLSLARAFRRGLTPKRAAVIGAVLAIGLLTKLNFLGLLPGAFVGLLLLTRRAAATSRETALRSLAIATSIASVPGFLYIARNLALGHPPLGIVTSALHLSGRHGSIWGELSYLWQYYLPRIPGMHADFHGISTTRELWIDGLIGKYGWLDTVFPNWAYTVALVPLGAIVALALRALTVQRRELRARLTELLVYALLVVGLMVLVGGNDYLGSPKLSGGYIEPRYFVPAIALWGGLLALSARGAGRRYGPAVGVAIVMLAMAHDLFSQLLVVSRYYG